MWNFQDSFETCKRSFISVFSICMTILLRYMLSILLVFEIYIEKKVLEQRFWFLHGLDCSIKCFIWNKSCLLLNDFMFSCCFCVFLNNFFVPLVDVNRGGVGVQISNVESTLSVAQWVWMAPLRSRNFWSVFFSWFSVLTCYYFIACCDVPKYFLITTFDYHLSQKSLVFFAYFFESQNLGDNTSVVSKSCWIHC